MRDKTVTFLVKSVRTNRMPLVGDTTVKHLKMALEEGGYDVEDADIRIIRDGHSYVGHVKNVLLHDNDIVVFKTNELQLRVSPDIARKHDEAAAGCSPDCCDSRVEKMKNDILAAIECLKSAVRNA